MTTCVELLHEASTGFPIRRAAVARRAEKSRVQSNCMPCTAQAAISGSFVDKARDVPRGIAVMDAIYDLYLRAGQLRATPWIASSIVISHGGGESGSRLSVYDSTLIRHGRRAIWSSRTVHQDDLDGKYQREVPHTPHFSHVTRV